MKKVQTQTQSSKQDVVLNSSINLKGQLNALKAELDQKTKKYADDILGYNVKVNELEEIIEKKDAQSSIETINLLDKISELDQKLLEKQEDSVRNEKELNYRANKLDEYELKIYTLEDAVKNLKLERDRNSTNVEQKFLAFQQTMENKSERTLKSLGDVLSTLKVTENRHREGDIKTPGVMESLIRMLQSSDENYRNLQERTSTLEVNYNSSIQENTMLKSLLYINIISRYNFHIFLANVFENAINGLIADLHTVLQHLSVTTKPTNSECLIQINNLKLEYFKYKSIINDLQAFKFRIDKNFATNKISFTMESLPEFKNMYIPVSILHISYLPMAINTLRQQNLINAVQLHMACQQLNVPPVYMQPFVNNAPVLPQVSYDNIENSVTIEDISSQIFGKNNSYKSAESENSVNSSNSKDENRKIDRESPNNEKILMCFDEGNNTDFSCQKNLSENNENDLIKDGKNCSDSDFILKDEEVPKIASFKLTIKKSEVKTIKKNVLEEYFTEKNEEIVENDFFDVVSSDTNDLLKNIYLNKSPINSLLFNETSASKNSPINSSLRNSQVTNTNLLSTNNLIKNNPLLDQQISINPEQMPKTRINPNNSQSEHIKLTDFGGKSSNRLQSLIEPIEGIDMSVLDKLGGSNRLVKLYFFVKDKAKVEMLHTTDEELVNAILAVRNENTLNGMRKKDILVLIFDFLKKQTETAAVNTPKSPKLSFCVICFDSNDLEPSKTLSCNHQFHISCLQHWFQRDNVCPVCRKLVMAVDDLS